MIRIKRSSCQTVMFRVSLLCVLFSGYMVLVGTENVSNDILYIVGLTISMFLTLSMLKLSQNRESISILKFID